MMKESLFPRSTTGSVAATLVRDAVVEARLGQVRVAWCLTPRQSDIVRQLAMGDANKEIAVSLGVSARTVEQHVADLLEKIGADSRLRLVSRFWTDSI